MSFSFLLYSHASVILYLCMFELKNENGKRFSPLLRHKTLEWDAGWFSEVFSRKKWVIHKKIWYKYIYEFVPQQVFVAISTFPEVYSALIHVTIFSVIPLSLTKGLEGSSTIFTCIACLPRWCRFSGHIMYLAIELW